MTKIKNVSLESMIDLASELDGTKLYKIIKSESRIFAKDVIIDAILDCNDVLYNSRKEFNYYGYKKSNQVFFDKEKNPYWKASLSGEFFRLYDGIFLGHHGCGGYPIFLEAINRMKSDLLNLDNGEIVERYNEFYRKYLKQKEKVASDSIRAGFGIGKNNTGEGIIEYLRFEDDENKEVLIFWKWFMNNFIDKTEYEKKIKLVRAAEHKQAFKKYVKIYIKRLEGEGFQRVKK